MYRIWSMTFRPIATRGRPSIDFHTTQTVTHHPGLHFPSSIALITQAVPITWSPESYYTHYITPTQILLKLLIIVCVYRSRNDSTLRSQFICLSLSCLLPESFVS